MVDTLEILYANQQIQIDANTTNITRIEGEMPTLEMEGTTLVVGTRSGS